MKVGETCYLSTLPKNVFPVDWALDIAQIPPTTRELTTRKFAILVLTGGEMSTDGLYPKIKEICNSRIKTFEHLPNFNNYIIPTYKAIELLRGVTISVSINGNQVSSVHGSGYCNDIKIKSYLTHLTPCFNHSR